MAMSEDFQPVARVQQVPPGRSVGVTVCGQPVAIFNLGDELIAVENRCPHQGAPLAGSPIVGKSRVRCMLHGWLFDLRGSEEDDGLKRYPVRQLEDGAIEVCVGVDQPL
jgi:3-phenylpropionate/trans-cinnamate dioxygenase ferredoxin subunit